MNTTATNVMWDIEIGTIINARTSKTTAIYVDLMIVKVLIHQTNNGSRAKNAIRISQRNYATTIIKTDSQA